jgi:hypothetical protein
MKHPYNGFYCFFGYMMLYVHSLVRHSRVESWDLRYMQLGVASFTAIADRQVGPHVKHLDFGGAGGPPVDSWPEWVILGA